MVLKFGIDCYKQVGDEMFKHRQKVGLGLGVGLLLLSLAGCETSPSQDEKARVSMSAEQRKLDEKQISLAIRECLHDNVVKAHRSGDTAQEVAQRLHGVCEIPFMALRQSKLGYVDLPDIETPPPQVTEEEVAVCLEVVERFRVYRKEAIKERLKAMPPGWKHPPVPDEKSAEQTQREQGFF